MAPEEWEMSPLKERDYIHPEQKVASIQADCKKALDEERINIQIRSNSFIHGGREAQNANSNEEIDIDTLLQ
ncbi:hypothetical protein H5410_060473 [Solanum commersonii]|uniref:Uncharacterized protein n=1 Tax=Solanum commersonii TaxID=4109 RepID=A0A9J5W558_SOLCO|nr:hypothetical protein H5410_060473 [Solanum commersonii]